MQFVESAAAVLEATGYQKILEERGLYGSNGQMNAVGLRRLLAYAFKSNSTSSETVVEKELPPSLRVLILVFLSILGNFVNVFFISCFFVMKTLRTSGNVYLACVGLADLIITSAVMPTVVVVLVSGIWTISSVCHGIQFVVQASAYMFNLLFMMASIEQFLRECLSTEVYRRFLSVPPCLVSVTIIAGSFAVTAVGVRCQLEYDHCTRQSYGNIIFRWTTVVMFQILPFLVTTTLLVHTSNILHARATQFIHTKKYRHHQNMFLVSKINLLFYFIFIFLWIPYLIIVNKYPDIADSYFYSCVWLGLSRTTVASLIYGFNKTFKKAFIYVFFYCCCRTVVEAPRYKRNRRDLNKVETHEEITRDPVLKSALKNSHKCNLQVNALDNSSNIGIEKQCEIEIVPVRQLSWNGEMPRIRNRAQVGNKTQIWV